MQAIVDFQATLKKKQSRYVQRDSKAFINAAKRLRASMGISNVNDKVRFIKVKRYPTTKKLNEHGTRKYPLLFCLSKRRDILDKFIPGDILDL